MQSMTTAGLRASSSSSASYEGTTNGRGEPHGEGRRVFSSGHVYEGRWQDGRCHGFGRFSYPDGQVFEGEWRDGRRNGEGKLSMPNGEVIAGTWVDDTLSGPCRRWLSSEEAAAPPPVVTGPATSSSMVADRPAAAAAPLGPVGGGPAGDSTDVAWLRESHDVIWQLNVELQMENEKLVAENRRLRLKLRQMLQGQQGGCGGGGGGLGSQNYNCNTGCSGQDCHGCGGHDCRGGRDGGGKAAAPKVVEGRLKRRGKKEREGERHGASMLASLLDGVGGGSRSSVSVPREQPRALHARAPPRDRSRPALRARSRPARSRATTATRHRSRVPPRPRATAAARRLVHPADPTSTYLRAVCVARAGRARLLGIGVAEGRQRR